MPPPPSFPCTHCPTTFSKYDKLQRHLLTAHQGQLCLSPDHPLSPSPLHTTISTALQIANAAFSRLPPAHPQHCPYCPDSHKHKPFRNAMDLSQHLVAKHDDLISPVTPDPPCQSADNPSPSAPTNPNPIPHPPTTSTPTINSKVSVTTPANPANPPTTALSSANPSRNTTSNKRPISALHNPDSATSPPLKQSRTKPPAKSTFKSPAAPTPVPNTTKSTNPAASSKALAQPNPTSPTDTTAAKKRRNSRTGKDDVALSATKPPTTPKKKDGGKGRPVPPWLLGEELRLPKQAAVTAAPLDFTWFGGLQANTHQGYYRLVDR